MLSTVISFKACRAEETEIYLTYDNLICIQVGFYIICYINLVIDPYVLINIKVIEDVMAERGHPARLRLFVETPVSGNG